MGSGAVTVAPASGVTLRTPSSLSSRAQYSTIALRKRPSSVLAFPATNLLWRLKADDLTGSDGSAVQSWADSSGNNVTAAAQATVGLRPVLSLNAVNGHKAVKFDGTNDYLALSGTALDLTRNRSVLTFIVVASYDAVTGTSGVRNLLSFSTGTSSSSARVYIQKNGSNGFVAGGRRNDNDAASESVAGGTVATGQWAVYTIRLVYSATTVQIFKDGSSLNTNNAWLTAGSTSNTASQVAAIGSHAAGASEFWDGRIAEIIAYGADLTGTERSTVHTYVQNTYGIAVGVDYQGTGDEWVVSGDLA
jgi:hypothetical protein